MIKWLRQMYILPRFVRMRIAAAFALMSVIPILVAIYAITHRDTAMTIARAPVLTILLLICLLLACLGLHVMRTAIISIINIARTATDVIAPAEQGVDVNPAEIVRLERLLIYMGDQIAAARRAVVRYREAQRRAVRTFRLPHLVPAPSLQARITTELARAEQCKQTIGIFLWELRDAGESESADDSLIPVWLQDLLRHSGGALDALGRLRSGYWIGWISRVEADRVHTMLKNMRSAIADPSTVHMTVSAWCHPSEAFDMRRLSLQETAGRP